MKYDQTLKHIWKAASQEVSRYTLNAVLADVEGKCIVATDGHHMLVTLGIAGLLEPTDTSNFLVPIECLRSADALFTKQKRLTERERKPIYIRGTEDAVTVTVGTSKRGVSFDKVQGKFPEWKAITKDTVGPKAISISASLFMRLTEAMRGGSVKGGDYMTLFISDDLTQVVIGDATDTTRQSYGLLMPARTEAHKPKRFWLKSTPAPEEQ